MVQAVEAVALTGVNHRAAIGQKLTPHLLGSLSWQGILAVYAILIGPGMALLLHRLDRQALGWALLPAFALGVGAIATGVAVAGRADQRIVSRATLVQQIDEDTARANYRARARSMRHGQLQLVDPAGTVKAERIDPHRALRGSPFKNSITM